MSDINNLIAKIDTLAAEAAPVREVQKIVIPDKVVRQLQAVVRTMPEVDNSQVALSAGVQSYLMTSWRKSHPELADFLNQLRQTAAENGFYVLSAGNFRNPLLFDKDERTRKAMLVLLSAHGTPFGTYVTGPKTGLWHTHGVVPGKKMYRAESTGYIPFHMDHTNLENPPDGSILYCERPDRGAGGASLAVNYRKILAEFSAAEKEVLANVQCEYTNPTGLYGMGKVYNSHPLLELKTGLFRYNGKILADLEGDKARLYAALDRLFQSRAERSMLNRGDMIFVDQNQALHAREALRLPENFRADPKRDRLLWEVHTRAHSLAAA